MPLPRYAVRVDNAAAAIVDVLRAEGFHVEPMRVPTDALCSRAGQWHVLEFKTGKAGKLTPAQVKFIGRALAPVPILRDPEAAKAWAGTVP